MKAWSCYGLAGLLALLCVAITPECLRNARRIWRLDDEGLRIAAEITRIEEESVMTDSDSSDRARYGTYKIVEYAMVRYVVDGKEYSARHGLPEPIRRHKVGGTLAIMVLPDDPEHSFATHAITGDWIMSFMIPVILLGGAATFAGVGTLLRKTSEAKGGR